jgi:peptidoglycan/xylan/chitin deacetylase (PgdA/CDA1 family)
MCGTCGISGLSRRQFGAALLAVGSVAARPALAAGRDAPVEPHMRLADAPSDRRVVALTFDACPGAFDSRIASVLISERIPATIFITWLWMRRNPEGLKLLLDHPDLFALENHGELHLPPVLGSERVFGIRVAGDLPAIRKEVTNGAHAIQQASGVAPRWYRAATGFYTPSVIPDIEAMGFSIGAYSYSADEGASLPAARVAARMASARSGDVIVAHINQPLRSSGAGVVEGLRTLKRQGAVFARLDQVAVVPVNAS